MVTQIDRIRTLIQNISTGNPITTKDISKITGFPEPSIRRVLSGLVAKGEITRVRRGFFTSSRKESESENIRFRMGEREDLDDWHRKFIGTQKYKGNPRQFFALTYERNDIDRETELLDELDGFLNAEYVQSAGNTGYADDIIDESQTQDEFIFPSIQVGYL
jgi:alkylated DNA nucleotide flippase Atl1